MARFSRSCARGILAALLASIVGVPLALAETVLCIANMAEPETLDPHKAVNSQQINIARNLFEGLVVLDPKGSLGPAADTDRATANHQSRAAGGTAGILEANPADNAFIDAALNELLA